MIEERVLTPGELEIKQKAQTTAFPDLSTTTAAMTHST